MTYYSATTSTDNYTLLRVDGGFYDYHVKSGAASLPHYFSKTNFTRDRYWDTATATMVTASNTYNTYAGWTAFWTYANQQAKELFSASFETVNIFFDQEALDSGPTVEMLLVSAVSMAKLRITHASDGNYVFSTPTAADVYDQGATEETGSRANSTIRYKGSKQVVVHSIQFDGRDAMSIRFKVEAILSDSNGTYLDDIRIKAIHVLPNDVLFIGGETYA